MKILDRRTSARPRLCIDMDEVIADALGEHLARYNRDFGTQICAGDLRGRWLWDAVPAEHLEQLEHYVRSADFFRVLPIIAGAQEAIARLAEHYEIFIATAAMEVPSSFVAKYEWLAEHFPAIRPSHIVFCGDKSILDADYLLDDNPRQLRLFHGQGVMFGSPANFGQTEFPRVENWAEAERYFIGLLER